MWDVAAGQTHTLLLADGDCYQPILYYSGEQVMENTDGDHPLSGTCTQTPILLPFCMNVRTDRCMSVDTVIYYYCVSKITSTFINATQFNV